MAELATGSTPRRIAFDQHRPAGRYDEIVNGRRVTVLGGCGASPVDLYVSDPAQGTLRRWTGSNDRGLYPSLNAQGLQVAFNLDGHVRLLDVNGPERTLDQAPVLATPATCTVTGLMYQPGSENLLWVAQTCPSGTYLATYDTVTKRQRRNFQVADSASKVNIGSFDVKPDGEIVGTLSTFSGDGVDGRIFIISNAEVQQLPVSGVYQILW
jgi:hypothetical protein